MGEELKFLEWPEKIVVPERNSILQTAALLLVKRTSEWSKIFFGERKGMWQTDPGALKRRDEGVPYENIEF
jgi:hypothetical protein